MEELIAYRAVDSEGDVWCEEAFLFPNSEAVKNFFRADNPKLIEIYTEDGNEPLEDFKIHNNNPTKSISKITFTTEHAGNVKIVEMSKGYLITS